MAMTSVRMNDELMSRLEETASGLQRSKSWVINSAVKEFVEREEKKAQRLEETLEALADLEAGRVIDGDEVNRWIESWGTDDELEPPST